MLERGSWLKSFPRGGKGKFRSRTAIFLYCGKIPEIRKGNRCSLQLRNQSGILLRSNGWPFLGGVRNPQERVCSMSSYSNLASV